jgi:type VI secretion system protein ImpH
MQGPADEECLRLRPELSLGFSASDVAEIDLAERSPQAEGLRFQITTTFLGLYGPSSPLPVFYTENLLDQDPDESLVRPFLDIFHHRALSLLYRVWEKYRHVVQFQPGGTDSMSRRLMCLGGLDGTGLADSVGIPAVRLLAYAGGLTQRPRSAPVLRGILLDYFEGLPIEIEQCVEQQVEIPEGDRNLLGVRNVELGLNFSIGERVLDRSSTFRVKIGPLALESFLGFLPGGGGRAKLEGLLDLFDPDPLDAELELWIRAEEIPALQLSREPMGLGWSTWLGEQPGEDQYVRFLLGRDSCFPEQ